MLVVGIAVGVSHPGLAGQVARVRVICIVIEAIVPTTAPDIGFPIMA